MSLITLRSSAQDNGANVFESAAVWTNHFKKGIRLRPGNTLELVSMSINKIDKFEIILGQNDTFLWRIGAGAGVDGVPSVSPPFQQHQITIPAGSYNGLELASTIQSLCNTSTFLDLYKDQWICTYAQGTADSTGSFTLNYGQRETPAANFDVNTIEKINDPVTDGAIPTFTPGAAGDQVIAFPKSLGSMDGITTATHLFQGKRGIFGNAGQIIAQVTPFRVLDSVDLVGNDREFNSFKGDAVNYTGDVTELTPTLSGYNRTVEIGTGSAGQIAAFSLGAAGILKTDGSSAGPVQTGGTGYSATDTGTFTGGTGLGATYAVVSVAGGVVADYNITTGGIGYTVGDILTLSGKGNSDCTVQISAVNNDQKGATYVAGDIGVLTTVKGPAPSIPAKYRVLTVGGGGVVATVAILDNFKGIGYTVDDVLRLDGKGDQECYIRVNTVQNALEPYVGQLDEQGIFGMVSSEGKIWYNLETGNPWVNSFGAGSTDTFDTTGAEAGGYTFRRNKSAGTTPVYWVQDPDTTNQFLEFPALPIGGAASDTFDLIAPGVFLSQTYNSTVTSASWVGGAVPGLLTNLAQAVQSTATYRYKYNETTNIFDWDLTVDATRNIKKSGYSYFDLPAGNGWTQAPTPATENFDTLDLGDIATFRRVQVGGGTSWWEATSATNWNVYTVKPVPGTVVALTAVAEPSTGILTLVGGITFTPAGGVPGKIAFVDPFVPVFIKNYGSTGIGWVRNDLVTGRINYPGNANATFSLESADCDLLFNLKSNITNNNIQVELFQMTQTGTANYPAPGWRTGKTVFSTRPADWQTELPDSAPAPATWTTFTYGEDVVAMSVVVTGIRTMGIRISHDTAGDGVFLEDVELINSGQTGMGGQALTKNAREVFYPLRPIVRLSRGSTFDGRTVKIIGTMDTQEVVQTNSDLKSESGGVVETWHDGDPTTQVGDGADPANATKFSALFKFGSIDQSQVVLVNPTLNQVLTRDLQPNTGNVQNVFGFENVYSYPAGNATNATNTETGRVPMTQILEPSLHVELTDFNIQSWSGESGDSTKAIAVIPREQWTTDSTKGTLHWQSQYPQPVELNLTETRTLYTLTARIREPSGELVKDLINPTELTLRIGETSESRQQRVMDKAMEKLAGAISNRQDQRISDIGVGMPRI